jgi:ankyrin repeat protein
LVLGSSESSDREDNDAHEAIFRACCSGDADWLAEVLQERQQGVSGLLTRAIVSGQAGAVEMLLRAGLNIGKEPELDGWGPLTYAAVNMDCRVLGVLLSHEGTRPVLDYRGKNGCTALWWANCLGRREAVGLLIRAGADIKLRSTYDTCVWKAVSRAGREEFHHQIGVSRRSDIALA